MKKRKRQQTSQPGGSLQSPGGAAGTPGVSGADSSASLEAAGGETPVGEAVDSLWDGEDSLEPEELEAAFDAESESGGVEEEGGSGWVAQAEALEDEDVLGEGPADAELSEAESPDEQLLEAELEEEPQVSEEMEALLAELSAAATASDEAAAAEAPRESVTGEGDADVTEGMEGLLSELLGGEEPEELEAAADDLEAVPEPGAFESLEEGLEGAESEVGEPELFLAGEDFAAGAEEEFEGARAAEPEGVVLPARNLSDVVAAIDAAIANAPHVVTHAFGGAAQLAQQKQPLEDYVVFSMADMDYALPIEDVLEIGSLPLITRVPSLPEFVRGIMNHRGEVVTVLSLPLLFGYAEPSSGRARILLVRPKNRSYKAALLVEDVKGIQRIPSQQLQRAPRTGANRMTAVLRGLHGGAERTLGVMDLGKLFVLPEVRQLEPQ